MDFSINFRKFWSQSKRIFIILGLFTIFSFILALSDFMSQQQQQITTAICRLFNMFLNLNLFFELLLEISFVNRVFVLILNFFRAISTEKYTGAFGGGSGGTYIV